ncbi:MAG: S1 RNA-binding domain-containing protein, partial [Spirochaetes bacterium]|nr:S1 RNA-binding domain-containing protein [Spirochaetota bacterium]
MSDNDPQQSETMKSLLQEELQEEFLKPLDQLEVGQIVEGTVVQVGSEQVFVDIGYKSEGRIATEEFDELPEIGDVVQVVLLNKDTSRGGA